MSLGFWGEGPGVFEVLGGIWFGVSVLEDLVWVAYVGVMVR